MFQCILVIVLSALLDVWAYVGHVALVPLSSNPQARWRGWPEGQLDIYIYIYIYILQRNIKIKTNHQRFPK